MSVIFLITGSPPSKAYCQTIFLVCNVLIDRIDLHTWSYYHRHTHNSMWSCHFSSTSELRERLSHSSTTTLRSLALWHCTNFWSMNIECANIELKSQDQWTDVCSNHNSDWLLMRLPLQRTHSLGLHFVAMDERKLMMNWERKTQPMSNLCLKMKKNPSTIRESESAE